MKEVLHFKLLWPKTLVDNVKHRRFFYSLRRIFFIMKFIGILLLLCNVHLSANTMAQHVTLQTRNSSLKEIFKELHNQTGYYFIYNENLVKRTPLAVNLKDVPLSTALNDISTDLGLSYTVKGKTIIREKNREKNKRVSVNTQQETVTINGVVYDTQEPPVPQVVVTNKENELLKGVLTKEPGFSPEGQKKGKYLVFSVRRTTGLTP